MEKQQLVLNKVPKESQLAKRVKPLGPNETKKYRLYGSYDPLTKKYSLRDLCIPNRDIVTDPDTGETYDIAFVNNMVDGNTPIYGEIWFTSSALCKFVLSGNKVRDRKIHDFIEMSNFISDNPFRDKSAPLLIERIDDDSDSNQIRNIRKQKQKAWDLIEAMSDTDITSVLKQNNLPVAAYPNGRRDTLEAYVDAGGAEKILKSSVSESADSDSHVQLIQSAKKSEKISYDSTSRAWTAQDGTLLFSVKKGIGASPVGDFAKFLGSPDGKDSLEKINSL